jgi:acyl carrier protein
MHPDRADIRTDLLRMLRSLRDDWDWPEDIADDTGMFRELGLESIDLVALGSMLEEHYDQALPFAEFLTWAKDERVPDITIKHLVDFLADSLRGSATRADV